MSKTSVFVKLKANPGKDGDVLAALEVALPAALDEPGTEMYTFHNDKGDADTVWAFELYADDDAFAAHSASEAVAALFAEVGGLLAEPPMLVVGEYVAGKGVAP